MRVLKPSGSIFVNLGDRYANDAKWGGATSGKHVTGLHGATGIGRTKLRTGLPPKSLMMLPERYRIGCVDELGLIARAVIIWNKPNGLPESVTDRVKRSHEDWVHLTKQPRYYSAVDNIREPHAPETAARYAAGYKSKRAAGEMGLSERGIYNGQPAVPNALGKLPGSVWTIATQPLKVPVDLGVDHFACVDTDTEVLTRRGWLRHDAVQVGDEVAGYDLTSGLTTWTPCQGVHRYDYDGELVTADARGLSMRLTPNHRTIVHTHRGRHRYRGDAEVIEASALDKRRHSIPRSVRWAEDGRELGIGIEMAALCGWVASEGWYGTTGCVFLSQSATANPDKVADIDKMLAAVPHIQRDAGNRNISYERGKYRARLRHAGQRVNLGSFVTFEEASSALLTAREQLGIDGLLRTEAFRTWRDRPYLDVTWRLPRGIGDHIRKIMPGKLLTAAMVDLPLDEARALLDAFVDGDGHRRADGRASAFQKHRQNLDVLQAIAVRLGYNTTLKRDNANNRWVLYMNPPRPARLCRADGTSLVGRERYTGTVWCVTTGTGTFVARRNGTVFVTGNSFPMAWPRRIIQGWSPPGYCTACGQPRRPAVTATGLDLSRPQARRAAMLAEHHGLTPAHIAAVRAVGVSDTGRGAATQSGTGKNSDEVYELAEVARAALGGYAREYLLQRPTALGEACACPDTSAPTRPAVVLDPFGGTGTTALVASVLGRVGVSVDMSADYCRLAQWRTTDPKQRARAARDETKPPRPRANAPAAQAPSDPPDGQLAGQLDLFA